MAKIQRISVHGHTSASPEAVYALLVDRERWPDWSPMGAFRLLGKGDENGLGAVGVFSTNGVKSCEEVIALEPGKRFGYALKKGLPLRDYRAYVDLTPERGGTEIHWHSTFTAKLPGTGWFYRRFLGLFLGRMVESLVARASRGAP
ncbi:SRPBCC family protein [Amycolatopsis sp. TNS106]|uniref:SRPBCC family protein n=1 Tax=Amycolatopsis sp. TNS106 TaxID=2861750 RepID=UPI001C5629A1|nr:SRPBCC family protein [Amycolatopsis sp. TNS106]QXV58723.1 SRPBCC family protein [Amycolatopsis sp. TNS106]